MSEAVQIQQVRVKQGGAITPGDVLLVVGGEVVAILPPSVKVGLPPGLNGHELPVTPPADAAPEPQPGPAAEPSVEQGQASLLERAFEEVTYNGRGEPLRPDRADLLRVLAKYPNGVQARTLFELFGFPKRSPDRSRVSSLLRDCQMAGIVAKKWHKTGKWKRPAYALAPEAKPE
jgi:hypothetical protein